MAIEHLCKSCLYTHPTEVGKECGNGYLYLKPKTACVGYAPISSVDLYNDGCYNSSTVDGADYGMSDVSSGDYYINDNDSAIFADISISPGNCNRCGKKIEDSHWFSLHPDGDDDPFHLHAKCAKVLLKHLIKLERNKSDW